MRFLSRFPSSYFFFLLFPPFSTFFFSFGQPQEWPSMTSLFCRLLIIAQLTSYYRGWHAPLIVHHHANTFLSSLPLHPSGLLLSFTSLAPANTRALYPHLAGDTTSRTIIAFPADYTSVADAFPATSYA